MFRNWKFKRQVAKQELNTLGKFINSSYEDQPVATRMKDVINHLETLLLEIQQRSSILCAKQLRFSDYTGNPPKDIIQCSGKALALLGRFRTDLKSTELLDQLEELLMKIQCEATYAASIKKFQVHSTGICLISDAGCSLALLGRLRLDQKQVNEKIDVLSDCDCDCDCGCGCPDQCNKNCGNENCKCCTE